MKRYFYIPVVMTATLMLSTFTGCQKDEDSLDTQRTSTERFLESSHQPRLMSEEAARESLDENPEYYTSYDNKTYRYIATMYAEGRDVWPEIGEGDLVAIYFNAYVFSYSAITGSTMPYWSNYAEVIAALEQTAGHLDPEYWSSEPLIVRAGGSDALDGVSRALVGCRVGDNVEVYMTYAAAYGKNIVGLVPKESPVAWMITIVDVSKQ